MERNKGGLYYPNGSFSSREDIKKRMALEGQLPPVFEDIKRTRSFGDFSHMAIRRSADAREFSPQADTPIKIKLPRDSTINFISDVHVANPYTDHKRIHQEIETIVNNPNSYILLGGDLIEGIFWGGAGGSEQVMSLDEQQGYLRSLFRNIKGRVICATSGEHDSKWAAKSGMDPYSMFTEITGAPYKRGIVELDVTAGDQNYQILMAHKMRGNSIYNSAHPPMRASREMQGFDIYVSGHTHRKAIGQQPIRSAAGAKIATFGVSGPYKTQDEYAERSGFASQCTKQLYGFALRIHAKENKVEIEEDILYANKKWR